MEESVNCVNCDKSFRRYVGMEVDSCEQCLWQHHLTLTKQRMKSEGKRKALNAIMLHEELSKMNNRLANSKEGTSSIFFAVSCSSI